MSVPFVKFDESNKLSYIEIKKYTHNHKHKVISIIGNARTGKSTLLNCIASRLHTRDIKCFEKQDTSEHCTRGLDIYVSVEHKLTLIDCQGLKLDDSSCDPQLLLLVYKISDIIIYNQKSILNNDIFDTLSPLCSFINYMEISKHKPVLYFRLGDVDLAFDPKEHLSHTLSNKKDQYQNVREALIELFADIKIGCTSALDRGEKTILKTDSYLELILNEENKFCDCIDDILSVIASITINTKFSEFITNTKSIIKQINANEKIDCLKLDTYTLLLKSEINDYLEAIDADNYLKLSVSMQQKCYDSVIAPRIQFRDNCLAQFKTRFGLVSNDLITEQYKRLYAKLSKPIITAEALMSKLADECIKGMIADNDDSARFKELFINISAGDKATTIDKFDVGHIAESFINKIQNIYGIVRDKYIEHYRDMYAKYASSYQILCDDGEANILLFDQYTSMITNYYTELNDAVLCHDIDATENNILNLVAQLILQATFPTGTEKHYFNHELFKYGYAIPTGLQQLNDILIDKFPFMYKHNIIILSNNEMTITEADNKIMHPKLSQFWETLCSYIKTNVKLHKYIIKKMRQQGRFSFSTDLYYEYPEFNCKMLHDRQISYDCTKCGIKNFTTFCNCVGIYPTKADIKLATRKLHLDEFIKYIKITYKKKMIIANKVDIINALIFDKSGSSSLHKLYSDFTIYYDIIHNKITGFKLCI